MITTASQPPKPMRPRPSGVVVPRPLRWHQRALASLIYAGIRLVSATLRYRWEIHPALLERGEAPAIFCTWHNRLALSLVMYERLALRTGRVPRLAAIVSASRDGGMVARILEHFRAQPVRGSSSRRGPQALLELTTWAERGHDLAITPDGPRGPMHVVQPGAISLAQLTGLPVVPAAVELRWKIRAPSWDRFQIPLPFGRCLMKFGEPLSVPVECSDEEREALRQELERRLRDLSPD